MTGRLKYLLRLIILRKEIAKVKDNATKAIAGDVKRITAEIQKNALKKVNDTLK